MDHRVLALASASDGAVRVATRNSGVSQFDKYGNAMTVPSVYVGEADVAVFSSEMTKLLFLAGRKGVQCLRLQDGTQKWHSDVEPRVFIAMQLSANGQRLFLATADKFEIFLLDSKSGDQVYYSHPGITLPKEPITCHAEVVLWDGRLVVTSRQQPFIQGHNIGYAMNYDIPPSKSPSITEIVTEMALTCEGDHIVVGYRDGSLSFFSADRHFTHINDILWDRIGINSAVNCLAHYETGTVLIGYANGRAAVVQVSFRGQIIRSDVLFTTPAVSQPPVTRAAFCGSATRFVTAHGAVLTFWRHDSPIKTFAMGPSPPEPDVEFAKVWPMRMTQPDVAFGMGYDGGGPSAPPATLVEFDAQPPVHKRLQACTLL